VRATHPAFLGHLLLAILVCASGALLPNGLNARLGPSLGTAHAATQGAPRIRVKGSAHLDVRAARRAGGLAVSGIVVDDAARPIAGAHVGISFALASNPLAFAPLSSSSAQACAEGGTAPTPEGGHMLGVTTDEGARFCVRVSLATNRYVARIEARGSEFVEGGMLDVPIDLALPLVTLRFDSERLTLSLDDDSSSVQAVATTEEEGVTEAATGLTLSLSSETGTRLAQAVTDASGRAQFTFDSAALGPPGRGELRVAFAGSPVAGPSVHAAPVERRTRVDLASPDAKERRLPIGSPEDGIALRLIATPRCARRGCIGSVGGTIEARVGGTTIVGAAPVNGGEARLSIAFDMPGADDTANVAAEEIPLAFRYVSNAPWWQPASDLVLGQPVQGPSPWKRMPLVLAAVVVVVWMALARVPLRRHSQRSSTRPPARPPVGEGVSLVQSGAKSHGWTGVIGDAHDGAAVARARVAVERRGFDRVDVVVETTSDASGRFALPPIDVRPGDELVAEGPLHAMLRNALPPPGELAVALASRRRALLDRLVAWARSQGAPYVVAPDPSPGHVQRAAGSNAGVARWASAVEQAAFGASVVDKRTQAEVDCLAPPNLPRGPS